MAVEELGLRVVVEGFGKFMSSMKTMDKSIAGTAKSWTKAGKSASGFVGVLDRVAAGLRGFGSSARETLSEMQGLGLALTGVSVAGGALIRTSALTAARTEELGMVLEVLAGNARDAALAEGDFARASELTTSAVWKTVDAIESKGITTQVATKLTAQFVRYELDMAQATELARVAQDAAVISMQDSSQALDGLLHGIMTYNPRVLRTYGITIQTKDAFEAFAAANGLVADELTNSQRAQAMLNAVLKEGKSITGAYDAAMGSAGKRLRSLSRHLEEAKNALGRAFLPAMDKGVIAVTNLVKAFNALEPQQQKAASGFLAVTTAVAGAAGSFILLAPRVISLVNSLGPLVQFTSDTTVAMQLLGQGASMSGLGMAGLAASAAAALIPLAALAAIAGVGYLAITNLDYTTEEAAESMGDFAEASAILNPELAELGDVTGEATEQQYLLQRALEDEKAATEALNSAIDTSVGTLFDWEGALSGTHAMLGNTTMAANEAAGAVEDLAERAKDLASTFGELEFDNEAIWEMARASGASLEALSNLAVQLDIASNAEIQASMDVAMLNQQLGDGMITADEYVVGMNAVGAELASVEASTIAVETATTAMYEDVLTATGALDGETVSNRELTASLGETTAASDNTAAATDNMYESILNATVAIDESTEAERIYTGATDDMYESVLGLTEATDKETAALHLEKSAMEDAATSTQNMYGELINATSATDNASDSASNLTGNMNTAAGALNRAANEAKAAADALNSIPKTIDIHVITHYSRVGATETTGGRAEFQHGTSFFRGGMALVGEAGPEIVVLPRGSQVIPNNQITNNSYNYNLTTNATTRPGGLRMEFDTMAMATR